MIDSIILASIAIAFLAFMAINSDRLRRKESGMSEPLLLRFGDAQTEHGVDRATLKAVAEKLGVSETVAVHIAINRLHQRLFPEKYNEDLPSDAAFRQIKAENPERPGVVDDDIRDRIAEHEADQER